jgi:hypothetical protein
LPVLLEERNEYSLKKGRVPAEIRTKYVWKASLNHYHYNKIITIIIGKTAPSGP